MKYNVIDFFSGAGGLSLGFKQAGFNILAGVDFDENALKTFSYNMNGAKALKEDLFDEKKALANIGNEINGERVDVIIAGPPCQGFSLTGSRDLNDTRNKLYLAVYHAVEHFLPSAFLIENVPGMATLYGGAIKKQIVNSFTDLGYDVSVTDKPLYAPEYGVPQIRKRMFFVGLLKKKQLGTFKFPKPLLSENDFVTTKEAIGDLPSLEVVFGEEQSVYIEKARTSYQRLMRKNSDVLFNHVGTKHTQEVIDVIKQVPNGGNHKDLPPGVGESRKFNEAWTRYHSDKPSKTIDTGHRNHFHYKWNRVPTVRENARLQSFPDDFRFLGTRTSQYRQVGNAVPPLLSEVLAKELLKHLNGQSR